MNKLKSICVFCGSSEGNDTEILNQAEKLGAIFAERNITLVYGAGKVGIMGKVAQATLDAKGKVIGVIPEFLKQKEVAHLGLAKLITTENMHERKMQMQELSDGFITLPGGLGTLEELFEILTWSQLGLHGKPIGLLNINGFFDPMRNQLEHMVSRGFLKIENYELLLVDDNIDRLLEKMGNFKHEDVPKWLKPGRE